MENWQIAQLSNLVFLLLTTKDYSLTTNLIGLYLNWRIGELENWSIAKLLDCILLTLVARKLYAKRRTLYANIKYPGGKA